jgi:hypothetical protein
MNEDTPPPLPPQTPQPPVRTPSEVKMAPRWIAWIIASTVFPVIPWLTYGGSRNEESNIIFALTALAITVQIAASIAVGVGYCRRRAIGPGGAVGMSFVFMIASFAIGTAIWFTTCLTMVSVDYK